MSHLDVWNAAVTETQTWANGELALQRPSGSLLHKLLDAYRDDSIITPPNRASYPDPFPEVLDHPFESFVVEHDWAAIFRDYLGDDEERFHRPPFPNTCFEFRVSSKHCCLITRFKNEKCLISLFVRSSVGWFQIHLTRIQHLRKLMHDQFEAFSIALDAEVIETSVVRAPEKLNRSRARNGRLPLFDYHVVNLAHRTRALPADEASGVERASPRLHLRRGHWRHFDNFKTWINWMLVGDPDLGFIDKHYRM